MTYAADDLYQEVAYLAMHLHWSMNDLLDLEHADRARFIEHVASLTGQQSTGGVPWA